MFVEHKEAVEVTEAPAKTLKLSKAIRKCGYGDNGNYDDCVIGRAYKWLTGHSLGPAACRDFGPNSVWGNKIGFPINAFAANAFGVPHDICIHAERMCYGEAHSAEQIADWLEAQGY
jgi:hypothetical protein